MSRDQRSATLHSCSRILGNEIVPSRSLVTIRGVLAKDTSERAAHEQLEVYRRMAPAARLRAAMELADMSRQLLASGIRARHPEYTDEQVRLAAIRIWLSPEVFRLAYPDAPELEA